MQNEKGHEAYHFNNQSEDFSFSDQLKNYWRNKYVFLVSIIAFVSVGILYLYLKTPLYSIQSTLVIKDEKKGESISFAVKELDFLEEQKIIDNEAEIIRSENIVGKVVRSMNLNITYYEKENFLKKNPLFFESPVELIVTTNSEALYEDELDVWVNSSGYALDGKEYKYNDTITFRNAKLIISKSGEITNTKHLTIAISDVDETTQTLRASILASVPTKNSSILNVSMLHSSKAKGIAILTEIIKAYQAANVEEKRKQTDSIVALIDERLELIAKHVNSLETKEADLKRKQGLTFISDDARSYLERFKSYDKDYADAITQLENITKIGEYINATSTIVAPPNSIMSDPVLTNMVSHLYQLEIQRESLLKTSGPQNPSVLSISNQIESAKKSLAENIRLQKENLEKRIVQLQQMQKRVNSEISRVPGNERNLMELMRERTIRENIYSYLLEKREEASLSDASVFSKVRWVNLPFSTIKPVKPKKLFILTLALVGGFIFAILFIALREGFLRNKQFKIPREKFPYPVLGIIPTVRKFDYKIFENPIHIVTEQFRWIRTTLEKKVFKKEKKTRVILVTSFRADEGKSFVSLNLAASYAQYGLNTILVDLDLRKNKIADELQFSTTGFAEELNKKLPDFEKAFQTFKGEISFTILADNTAYNVAPVMFNKENIGDLISFLKSRFDCIIINTAPYLYFTDASLIETYADVNIFVVRKAGSLQRTDLLNDLTDNAIMKTPYIIYNDVPLQSIFETRQLKEYANYL